MPTIFSQFRPVSPDLMITCDKCRKLVDRVTVERDSYADITTVTVLCHGAAETTVVHNIDAIEWLRIEGATAFVQPLALEDESHD